MVFSLTGSGSLTGALCTNPGAPLANPNQITLTVAGAGTGASLSAMVLQTVTGVTVSTVGIGYGTVAALLQTVGGVPPVGSIANNPDGLGLAWRPRPAQIGLAVVGTGANGTLSLQNGTIYDGGMFLTNSVPTFVITQVPVVAGTIGTQAVVSLTMGSRSDIVQLQPAP